MRSPPQQGLIRPQSIVSGQKCCQRRACASEFLLKRSFELAAPMLAAYRKIRVASVSRSLHSQENHHPTSSCLGVRRGKVQQRGRLVLRQLEIVSQLLFVNVKPCAFHRVKTHPKTKGNCRRFTSTASGSESSRWKLGTMYASKGRRKKLVLHTQGNLQECIPENASQDYRD